MFPYTFPNIIVAFSILLYTVCEAANAQTSYTDLFRNFVLIIVFILIAKAHYGKSVNGTGERAFALSYNLAVLPILFADIYVLVDLLDGNGFGGSIMAYLMPFVYTPIVFGLALPVSYLWFRFSKSDESV